MRIILERIQKDFLWGDPRERRKIHMVNWSNVWKDNKYKGMGQRRLEGLNQALLGKWLWSFSFEWESLWRKIIHGKFKEMEGRWTTRGVRDSFDMSIWKEITKGWEQFSFRLTIQIWNGRHPRFWWDGWAREFKLKSTFPVLFIIASLKNAIVADPWDRGGGGGKWEFQFRRPFQDWEIQEVTHFLELIYPLKVPEGEDTSLWKEDRRGNSVSSHFTNP